MTFAADSRNEKESAQLNQYWYSQATIDTLVKEIELRATKCAFLSCPSLFFSLKDQELRARSKCFEFDRRWEADPGFVFYDFNRPDLIPVSLWEGFDMVVVDPPFITKEVWSKYIEAVKLLLQKNGKVLFTSVIENHPVLEGLLGSDFPPLRIPKYRPSIPHLTYQYHCFVNYPADSLEFDNPELPPEDPQSVAARTMANDMRDSQVAFASQMINRDRANEVAIPKLAAQQLGENEGYTSAMKWTRIPEGLTEYANGASAPPPSQGDEEKDFGPAYNGIVKRRETMEQFKKGVDQVMKLCDSILKVAPGAKSKTLQTPEALEAEKVRLIAEKEALLASMEEMRQGLAAADATDRGDVCVQMSECLTELGKAHTLTIDQYRELSADCTRKYKSKIFNRQKELLQQMKAAKKEFLDGSSAAPQKAAAEQTTTA